MLTLDDLRRFLKGEARTVTPAPDAARPRIGPPPKLTPPPGATTTAPPTGEFARRLITISGFGDSTPWGRDKVLLGLDPGELSVLPPRIDVFPRTALRPFNLLVIESTVPASTQLGRSLFKKLQGENDLESALERICQSALRGFAHAGGLSGPREPGIPVGKQTETVVVASIRDDRFDDDADADKPVHLMMFATRIGSDDQIKAGDGLETFIVRQECVRWEPQLFEEYTERVFKRHFERLANSEWREAFVIDEERKKARALLNAATNPREQLRLLGSASGFEKKLQQACVTLMEEVAKGFGLRSKNGKVLECLDLPNAHDIAADPASRDRRESNPLPGIIVRDHSSRLLGYIVYCLDSSVAVEVLRERLEKDNCFHNVLVIFPDLSGPKFELWQGTDRLEGGLVQRGAKHTADAALVSLLTRFFVVGRNRISDPKELAEELAKRARFLRRLAERQLDEEESETDADKKQLTVLYDAFKSGLIHAMTPKEFADAYAQTMTYGLLSARWISKDDLSKEAADKTRKPGDPVPQFTRAYAQTHLHSTSPFLQALFEKVLSEKFEPKLAWLLDDIAALLNQVSVSDVFAPKKVQSEVSNDPVIHFYEPFLAAYDKDMKKARGVYYTPQPVVSFIVRSVDDVLRTEFGLVDGLASTETWGDVRARFPDIVIPKGATETTTFVCILDPATGTGTFLVTVVETIFATLKARWEREAKNVADEWQAWVPKYLLPRLNAFELMVASYAVAHLKIGLKLRELGYVPRLGERANIFLTNALERWSGPTMFKDFLGNESKAADWAKVAPHTVVIGNPPYSVASQNNTAWIMNLLLPYKENVRREERQIQALSDDYVKFIRLGEFTIQSAGVGVLGMITNAGWTDGPLFRDMERSLKSTFSRGITVDLGGSSRRSGADASSGEADENVFDILQGVAIALLWSAPLVGGSWSSVRLRGSRTSKERLLLNDTHSSIVGEVRQPAHAHEAEALVEWSKMEPLFAFFATGSLSDQNRAWGTGFATRHDDLAIGWTAADAESRIADFANFPGSADEYHTKTGVRICTTKHWNPNRSKLALGNQSLAKLVRRVQYRPFDYRYVVYSRDVVLEPRTEFMSSLFEGTTKNFALVSHRVINDEVCAHDFVTDVPAEKILLSNKTSGNAFVFPVALRDEAGKLFSNICEQMFWTESHGPPSAEKSVSVLYALLSSPSYRTRYGVSLLRDFARLPRLSNKRELCELLAPLGRRLVSLHLLEPTMFDSLTLPAYTGPSAPIVEKPTWSENAVRINKSASFSPVPESVWNFHIGGYQVCEKWLKDRKGRTLTAEDIVHYRRIIAALGETIRIMGEIDDVIEKHGGWPGAFTENKG